MKKHPPEQIDLLIKSISEYGWTAPILADAQNTVIAGHGRLIAAERLGIETVPVIRLEHLTPDQARAYRIADNRLTEMGGWDMNLLAEEIDELKMVGFDIDLTGWGEIQSTALSEIRALNDVPPPLEPDHIPDGPRTNNNLSTFKSPGRKSFISIRGNVHMMDDDMSDWLSDDPIGRVRDAMGSN